MCFTYGQCRHRITTRSAFSSLKSPSFTISPVTTSGSAKSGASAPGARRFFLPSVLGAEKIAGIMTNTAMTIKETIKHARERIAFINTSSEVERYDYFAESGQQLFMPSFLRRPSAGHHPVIADWIRFTPTKAVQMSHQLLTQIASARLIRIKDPAVIRMHFSMVIFPLRVMCDAQRTTFKLRVDRPDFYFLEFDKYWDRWALCCF